MQDIIKFVSDNKFTRFLFVGGVNTLFGYAMFAVLIFLDFHYSIAVLLSTILGVLFNFKTTGRLVFGNNNNKLIFKFIGVYVFTFIMNLAILKVFSLYEVSMYMAGAFTLLPAAVVSFFMHKRFVFEG